MSYQSRNRNSSRSIQRWLDSKVSDKYTTDIYSMSGTTLHPTSLHPTTLHPTSLSLSNQHHDTNFIDMSKFSRYYDVDNDQDLASIDTFQLQVLAMTREHDPEEFENNKDMQYLDSCIERYRVLDGDSNNGNSWSTTKKGKKSGVDKYKYKEIDVLIPPNSNRYHANYLFKQLVDYCQANGVDYVNPNFKDIFYEFCCRYTT